MSGGDGATSEYVAMRYVIGRLDLNNRAAYIEIDGKERSLRSTE